MRDGTVYEEVDDMQEVRGSNPCKGGEMQCDSPLIIAGKLYNFTAFPRKIMYEICGENNNFSPLILHIFPIFPRPGKSNYEVQSSYKRCYSNEGKQNTHFKLRYSILFRCVWEEI